MENTVSQKLGGLKFGLVILLIQIHKKLKINIKKAINILNKLKIIIFFK